MTACSTDALEAGEALAGTAPLASAWIVIEQPGPWGRDALADSRLDPVVSAHLATAKASGVGVLLARHVDRPERTGRVDRNVWVARSVAGGHLLRRGVMASLHDLTGWDMSAIGAGHLPAFGSIDALPAVFVCTHSGRDRCCAVHGRALITDLLGDLDGGPRDRIWECSHIGGHRFAPVMLTLPSGAVHGRLDAEQAREVITRSVGHEVVLDRLRGVSGLSAPFQVAAIEVMRREGIRRDDQLDVLAVTGNRAFPLRPGHSPDESATAVVAEVRHRDGRAWRAELRRQPLQRERLESCGKDPVAATCWTCASLTPAAGWS